MSRRAIWAILPLGLALCAAPAAGQGTLATQGSGSAQPTLPKALPGLPVPVAADDVGDKPTRRARKSMSRGARHHGYARALHAEPVDRPALANVELLEILPHPPQPPHVTVPEPAYPFEDFVTTYTAPPPPVVCRPARYDRFKPDLGLVGERPVLCTADNP